MISSEQNMIGFLGYDTQNWKRIADNYNLSFCDDWNLQVTSSCSVPRQISLSRTLWQGKAI
jgi:hypothetical protein